MDAIKRRLTKRSRRPASMAPAVKIPAGAIAHLDDAAKALCRVRCALLDRDPGCQPARCGDNWRGYRPIALLIFYGDIPNDITDEIRAHWTAEMKRLIISNSN